MVLGLLSAPLMTSHLGVADFGRFVAVTSLITIVNTLSEAGVGNLAVREFSNRSGPERDEFMAHVFGLKIVLAMLGGAVAVGFGVLAGYDPTLLAGTALAGLSIVVANIQGVYSVPLAAGLRFGWIAVGDLVRQVVFVAAVVALVLSDASLLPFFGVLVLAAAAMLVATYVPARPYLSVRPRLDAAKWRAILRETLPFGVAAAVGILYFRVAVVVMEIVSSERETGLFAAAFRLTEVLAAVPYLLAATAFPVLARAARDDHERLQYALQRLFDVGLLLGAGVAAVLLAGAPFAIAVVTAGEPEFEAAVPVLRIQAVALLGTFLIATWSFALLSLHRYRALLLANLSALALVLGLTLVLAPSEGAQGTAAALTVTELYLAAALAYAVFRGRGDRRLSPWIVPRVAVAAGGGVAAALLSGLPALPAAVVCAAIYAVVVLALRAVPAELFQALRRR
jgi:O-antigen/teichoic acid export membrane protein